MADGVYWDSVDMDRRGFLKSFGLGVATTACVGPVGLFAEDCSCRRVSGLQRKPNILFIFSDDHAQNTIHAYNDMFNVTPNIDRIANEGAILKKNFCGNSICQPSRATVMTGKHSHLNGVTGNGVDWRGRQATFPKMMARKGYQTALFGKWHLVPDPTNEEFGHWEVLTGSGGQGNYYNPTFNTAVGSHSVEGYSTDIIADKAIDWLDNTRDADDPFMLMVQFKSPHVPRHPAIRHLHLFENETLPEPPTLHDDYSNRLSYAAAAWMQIDGDPVGLVSKIFRPKDSTEPQEDWVADWFARLTPEQIDAMHEGYDVRNADYYVRAAAGEFDNEISRREYNYQRHMQCYLACVKAVDENVGRLLDWLDDNDMADNTVIVYSSDQSYFVGEHGWMEKRWMYEESLQMPFVIRWPGKIAAGTEVDELTQNIDHAPTLLDIVGLKVPDDMQGRSLMPLLMGETPDPVWRDSVYYHYYAHGEHNVPRHDGVRTHRYKLICYYTDDAYEMFDLQVDPHELNSVYGDAAYAAVQADMHNRLTQLRLEYKVPADHFVAPYI